MRCNKDREYHRYSDTKNILCAVYNCKRNPVGPLDHNVYTGSGFGVPHTKRSVDGNHSAS